jgi:PAS domain S-box-containing protein
MPREPRSDQQLNTQSSPVKLRLLLNAMPGLNVLLPGDDPAFTVLAASDSFLRETGKNAGEIVGWRAADVLPGGTELLGPLRRVLETRTAQTLLLHHVEQVRATCKPLLNGEGEVAFILYGLDAAATSGDAGGWEWDLDRNLIAGDQRTADLLCTGALVIGTPVEMLSQAAHPEDVPRVEAAIRHVLNGGDTLDCEYRVLGPDGSTRWLAFRGRKTRQAERLEGVVSDVTNHKNAELALAAHERRIASLIAANQQGFCRCEMIWSTDGEPLDYRFLEVNSWFETATGLSRGRVLGKTARGTLSGSDQFPLNTCGEVVRTGQPRQFEHHASGRWYQVTVAPGEGNEFLVLFRDVTEQKRAEADREQLLQTVDAERKRLQAVADQMPSGLILTDAEGRLKFVNAEAQRILGHALLDVYSPAEYSGFGAVHEDGTPFTVEEYPLKRALMYAETVHDQDLLYRRPDGDLVPVQVSAAPIFDDTRQLVGGVAVLQDRHEQKRAQQTLRESEQHLRKVLDSLFAFVGVLSPDGVLLEINRAPLDAAGLVREQVIGQPFEEVRWWRYSAQVQDRLRRAISRAAQGESSRFDVDIQVRDGGFISIDFMLAPMRGPDGAITHLIPSGVDITDRKRAEDALAKQLRLTQAITDNATTALFIMNDRQHCVFMNPAAEQMTGFTLTEVQGRPLHDVIHHTRPDGRHYPLEECPIDRAFPENNQESGEDVFIHRNGTFFPVAFTASPLREPGGVAGTIIEVRDIRGRLETERRLRESEERLRITLDAAGIGTFEYNPHTDEGFLDARAQSLWGRSGGVLSWGSGLDQLHPDDRQRVDEVLGRALHPASDGFFECEYRLLWPDGSLHWQVTRGSVYFEDQGSGRVPVLMRGILIDVTDRKRMEEALRENEERFRTLADHISQFAWMADATGWISWYNQRWYDYTGTTFEQMQGWGWREVHHADHLQRVTESFIASLQSGQPWEDTFPLRGRDGQYRWFLSRALPICDDNGRVVRWFGTNTDIDEQKRTEAELRRANEDLEQFAFSASHDLQEPLRNVAIFSQLLQRRYADKLDQQADELLNIVVEGAQRMGKLVLDLLAYTEAGSLDSAPVAPVSVEAILVEVLADLEASIRETGAIITRENLPHVAMKPVHLRQLLQNLLANAIRYRSEGEPPRVHVSALRQEDRWRISVSDNGIGIAPQFHDRIFGVFKRLHPKTGKYPGTGIGLAICQKIVERYRGAIWIESAEGKGSTFHFTVPAAGA